MLSPFYHFNMLNENFLAEYLLQKVQFYSVLMVIRPKTERSSAKKQVANH